MERPKPLSNEHQAIQSAWETRMLGEVRTIEGRFKKLKEEVEEVFAPLEQKSPEEMNLEEKKALAIELTDMIIVGLGCLDNLGFDFERLFYEKMEINWRKYSPYLIDELVSQGLTREEAIKEAKRIWNERGFDLALL